MKTDKQNRATGWSAVKKHVICLIAGILSWPFMLTAGEYVPSFETNLIFYVSFDKGADADRSAGLAKGEAKNVRLADGVKGQGMACVSTGGVSYAVYQASNNIRADAGTVAFFFRPNWGGTQNAERVFLFWPGRDNNGGWNSPNSISILTMQFWGKAKPQSLVVWLDDSQGGNHTVDIEQIKEWRAGEWRHLAFTWSPARLAVYVDGELKGTKDAGTVSNPGDVFYVGARKNGENSADGILDELRIYGSALSAGEIGILTGRPEYLAPRIMALDLKQNIYFLSEPRVLFRCELGGLIDPARYRLVAELVSNDPDWKTALLKPLRRWKRLADLMEKSRKIYGRSEAAPVTGVHALNCPAPREGFYTLSVMVIDRDKTIVARRESCLYFIKGPFEQ